MIKVEQPLFSPPGWMISSRTDLLLTWGSLFFVALAIGAFDFSQWNHWDLFYLIFIKIGIDVAHVFFTGLPIKKRLKEQSINWQWLVFTSLSVAACWILIFIYSVDLFKTVLAFVAIHHIFAQQYGLILVCRRNGKEDGKNLFLDKIMIWNLMLFPAAYWLSNKSSIAKSYFNPGDFGLLIPNQWIDGFHILFWSIAIIYLVTLVRNWLNNIPLNIAKLSLMSVTAVWLYGSIVIWDSGAFFWLSLTLLHGILYMAYSQKVYSKSTAQKSWTAHFAIIAAVLGISAAWHLGGMKFITEFGRNHIVYVLASMPLLVHYGIDFFIWRKGFRRGAA